MNKDDVLAWMRKTMPYVFAPGWKHPFYGVGVKELVDSHQSELERKLRELLDSQVDILAAGQPVIPKSQQAEISKTLLAFRGEPSCDESTVFEQESQDRISPKITTLHDNIQQEWVW